MRRDPARRRAAIGIVGGVLGCIALIALFGGGGDHNPQRKGAAKPHRQEAADPNPPPPKTISSDEVVDVLEETNPDAMHRFCLSVELLGPAGALANFKRGYHPEPGQPSAVDVYAAALDRC